MAEAHRGARTIPAERLLAHFARARAVSVASLKAPGRTLPLAHHRQEAYAFVRANRPDLRLAHVARLFGDRDHATILKGERAALGRGYVPEVVGSLARHDPAAELRAAVAEALAWHEGQLAAHPAAQAGPKGRERRAEHRAQAERLRGVLERV